MIKSNEKEREIILRKKREWVHRVVIAAPVCMQFLCVGELFRSDSFVFNMKVLILACCLLSCAAGKQKENNTSFFIVEYSLEWMQNGCDVIHLIGKSVFPRLPLLLKAEQTQPLGEKIVGGTQATPNEFPWQISLQVNGEKKIKMLILNHNQLLFYLSIETLNFIVVVPQLRWIRLQ